MRQFVTCLTAVFLAVLLQGCPFDSEFPLGTAQRLELDDRTTGYWVMTDARAGQKESMLLWVTPFNESEVYAELTIFGSGRTDRFRAFQVRIGGQVFWNLNGLDMQHSKLKHVFLRSTLLADGRLSLRFVDSAGVPDAVASDVTRLRSYLALHLTDPSLDDSDGAYIGRRPRPGEVENGRMQVGAAQGKVPACPGSFDAATWTNCVGEKPLDKGRKYAGEFKEGKYSGQGALTLPSGAKYAGEWRDGELGQGTFTSPTGWTYVGEWRDGKYSGQGTLTSPEGRKYVGEFNDGMRNGKGTVTYPDGARFVGNFKDNEGTGQGTEYRADGSVLRSGAWENDFFLGNRSRASTASVPMQLSAGLTTGSRKLAHARLKTKAKAKPGAVFRDCKTCPEMVVIPEGRFLMGSPAGEEGRENMEGPQHMVSISRPFAVGKFEVTFDEWDACLRAGGCSHNPVNRGWGRGRRPVIGVSWQDAVQYVEWLSRNTGKDYGLLTEAEWEYVARAGTTTAFNTGPTINPKQANIGGMLNQTMPVGSYAPNAFGLFDVHGNAEEWIQDCSNGQNYSNAPTDGSAWMGAGCTFRRTRGGFSHSDPIYVRSASQSGSRIEDRMPNYGFRIARTLD